MMPFTYDVIASLYKEQCHQLTFELSCKKDSGGCRHLCKVKITEDQAEISIGIIRSQLKFFISFLIIANCFAHPYAGYQGYLLKRKLHLANQVG